MKYKLMALLSGILVYLVGMGLLFASILAYAVDVNLAWDPVPDGRIAFYEVGHGPSTGEYAEFVTAPGSNAATVRGLNPGDVRYFAVRACDTALEQCSAWSNEVVAQIPFSAPTGLTIVIVVPQGPAGSAPIGQSPP